MRFIEVTREEMVDVKSEIEKLQNQEKDAKKKFEEKRENVFSAFDTYVNEILKQCEEDSKLKPALLTDPPKV